MTERERREGTGDTRDNVGDELDEATGKGRKKDTTRDVVETEESAGDGGAKDNLTDDLQKTQRD